jgi:hypothetical protein
MNTSISSAFDYTRLTISPVSTDLRCIKCSEIPREPKSCPSKCTGNRIYCANCAPVNCDKCQLPTVNDEAIQKSMMYVIPILIVKCNICSTQMGAFEAEEHFKACSGDCKLCGCNVTNGKEHLKTCNPSKPSCCKCNSQIGSGKLKEHQATECPKSKIQCFCGQSILREESLEHKRAHEEAAIVAEKKVAALREELRLLEEKCTQVKYQIAISTSQVNFNRSPMKLSVVLPQPIRRSLPTSIIQPPPPPPKISTPSSVSTVPQQSKYIEKNCSLREFNFKDAAFIVLYESGIALHVNEILLRMKNRGFETSGETPEKTLSALLNSESNSNVFVRGTYRATYTLVKGASFRNLKFGYPSKKRSIDEVVDVDMQEPDSIIVDTPCEPPKKKAKPKRPEGYPKRVTTAFFHYRSARDKQLRLEDSTRNAGDISAIASAEWRNLTDIEKQQWVDMESEDKKRFQNELFKYNQKFAQERKLTIVVPK